MSFLNNIFPEYFTSYEKRTDSNKDVNGKGTLERYNETIGDDIDQEIKPLIDELVGNTIDIKNMWTRFIPYLEVQMGVNVFIDNTFTTRRAILKVIQRLYTIKGTKKAYEVWFSMMGLTAIVTEIFNNWGFDSAITLDDTTRLFDSAVCPSCSDYTIALTGSFGTLTPLQLQAIGSIITWNQPIDAVLTSITYNGNIISPDFNNDFNIDFYI